MESKAIRDFSVKSASKGTVRAVFSTLNEIDLDGDVTLRGAFTQGAPVVISAYGHTSWDGTLPVGKGTISEQGTDVILDGQFFIDTTTGRDHFETVKELGELQEWSYSLQNVVSERGTFQGQQVRFIKSVSVKEVSPVLRGAGIGTRTLEAKSRSKTMTDAEAQRLFESYAVKFLYEEHLDRQLADATSRLAALKSELSTGHMYRKSLAGRSDYDGDARAMLAATASLLGIPCPAFLWVCPTSDMKQVVVSTDVPVLGAYRDGVVFMRSDVAMSKAKMMSIVAHEVRHAAGGNEAEATAYEEHWLHRLQGAV